MFKQQDLMTERTILRPAAGAGYQSPGLFSDRSVTDQEAFEYDVPAVAALLGTSLDAALTVDEHGIISEGREYRIEGRIVAAL